MHIQKRLVKSDHDRLSLKPYLIKKDAKTEFENKQGKCSCLVQKV